MKTILTLLSPLLLFPRNCTGGTDNWLLGNL